MGCSYASGTMTSASRRGGGDIYASGIGRFASLGRRSARVLAGKDVRCRCRLRVPTRSTCRPVRQFSDKGEVSLLGDYLESGARIRFRVSNRMPGVSRTKAQRGIVTS